MPPTCVSSSTRYTGDPPGTTAHNAWRRRSRRRLRSKSKRMPLLSMKLNRDTSTTRPHCSLRTRPASVAPIRSAFETSMSSARWATAMRSSSVASSFGSPRDSISGEIRTPFGLEGCIGTPRRRERRTSVPCGPATTSQSSTSACISSSPRPPPDVSQDRQYPVSRTVTVTPWPSLSARTSTVPSSNPYACTIEFVAASETARTMSRRSSAVAPTWANHRDSAQRSGPSRWGSADTESRNSRVRACTQEMTRRATSSRDAASPIIAAVIASHMASGSAPDTPSTTSASACSPSSSVDPGRSTRPSV